MLRIRLKDFKWKKRLAKLYRQNMDRFEVKVRSFQPRPEIERLWQNFKLKVHGWDKVPDLSSHLLNGNPSSHFSTWEVAIYCGDKLVAFSIFDRGQKSIGSLEAAYDVGYSKFSLGVFTMQVELIYCMEVGLDYYYPGFYPKGVSMFDYKLRPGQVEFFRQRATKWIPWSAITEKDWLLDGVLNKLKEAQSLLERSGFDASVKVFNFTNFPGIVPAVSDYNFMAVGAIRLTTNSFLFIRVAWDPLKSLFLIFRKELSRQTFVSSQIGKGKIASIGIPFYYDSSHADIQGVDERLKKILANGR